MLFLILCVALGLHHAESANILIIWTTPMPSYLIWYNSIAEALVERGHNLTIVGPNVFAEKSSGNYHPILLEGFYKEDPFEKYPPDYIQHISIWKFTNLCNEYYMENCKRAFGARGFQVLRSYPEDFRFDLILFDVTAYPCLLPLIKLFKHPPAMGASPFPLVNNRFHIFGNDINPAYVPYYTTKLSGEMNFLQRVLNYFWYNYDTAIRYKYYGRLQRLMNREFGEYSAPIQELEKYLSIFLVNINPVLQISEPLTSNIIQVGGLHVKKPKALPRDLKEIMDSAKHGVILFSLGSNVKSSKIPEETKQAILRALEKVKQTVLWKFETNMVELPKNVIIRKWLPQTDILAHPNMKLFITHGGGLSTMEAAYYGVPIIGIPLMVDQPYNVERFVSKGAGLKLSYTDLNEENLLRTINEITHKSSYKQNMKQLSERWKDQLNTPLERAVFWSEYTMKHNGTHFLDPKSRHLPKFVTSCLDVQLFLILMLILFIYVILYLIRIIRTILTKPDIKEKLK